LKACLKADLMVEWMVDLMAGWTAAWMVERWAGSKAQSRPERLLACLIPGSGFALIT